MVVSGLRSDLELTGGFLCGPPHSDQAQYLDFARCQTGKPLSDVPACALTGAGENRLDGFRAEFPVPDGAAQLCGRR